MFHCEYQYQIVLLLALLQDLLVDDVEYLVDVSTLECVSNRSELALVQVKLVPQDLVLVDLVLALALVLMLVLVLMDFALVDLVLVGLMVIVVLVTSAIHLNM